MNPTSAEEAVVQYRPFVVKTAKRFNRSNVQQEDLIQEGLLAVALAFRQWRTDGGSNFLTWIRRPVYFAMLRLSRESFRAGGNLRGMGRGPQGKETVSFHSLDAPTGEDGHTLHDTVGTFEEPPDSFVLSMLASKVSALDRTQRQVIRLRFHEGLSFGEVGKRLGISRESARTAEQKALERLKELMLQDEDQED